MNGSPETNATPDRASPLVYLIAGEPSGDAIGARLMAALKRRAGDDVHFAGLGGEAMTAAGLSSLFPIAELSVMGIFEILPRLAAIVRRMSETATDIKRLRPDVVVSIDAPAFCFGVWRRLKGFEAPLVHYVAPTVWAWRPGRARKYARHIQHLLALLPFEPPYFERVGLPCTFVGHPCLETRAASADGPGFRARHGLDGDGPVIGVLLGSRGGEISRLHPIFGDAVRRLAAERPGLRVVIPVAQGLEERIAGACADWPGNPVLARGDQERYDAMAACDVAIAASGTVALDLALAGVPMVIGYRLNPLTGALVNRMVRVDYVCLINLLLDRLAVPELLLKDCRADRIADEAARLLDDGEARRAQLDAGREALEMLRPDGASPSDRAAEMVLRIMRGDAGDMELNENREVGAKA